MKIKENFVLQEILDDYLVVPVGKEANQLHGIIKLNETGAFLWKHLSAKDYSRDDIIHLLQLEYDVDQLKASSDVDDFLDKIKRIGCVV